MNAYTCIDNTMPTGEEDQFNHALAALRAHQCGMDFSE